MNKIKKSSVLFISLFLAFNSCNIENSPTIKLVIGSGHAGFKDGNLADLNKPIRLTPYTKNSVIFADINNHAIRIATLDQDLKKKKHLRMFFEDFCTNPHF